MNVDPSLQAYVGRLFAPLRTTPAGEVPGPGALSSALADLDPKQKTRKTVNVTPAVAKMFSTAAINMWSRAVHSFLISSALSGVSPIWASVSGYYSSHYSVRAIAHALGYFQVFRIKKLVRLEYQGGRFVGTFDPKTGKDREHQLYWRVVKDNPQFASDPFFTLNTSGAAQSDASHRERANYADHLPQLPVFNPLARSEIIAQIEKISSIRFDTPPIPDTEGFPEVESVQVMAYHRLVTFRELLDEVLSPQHRFWGVHRDPPWARDFLDYQMISGAALEDAGQ